MVSDWYGTAPDVGAHMILRPSFPLGPNLGRHRIVTVLAIRPTTEKGHDVVKVAVIDLYGHVAARDGRQRIASKRSH